MGTEPSRGVVVAGWIMAESARSPEGQVRQPRSWPAGIESPRCAFPAEHPSVAVIVMSHRVLHSDGRMEVRRKLGAVGCVSLSLRVNWVSSPVSLL